MPTIVEPSVAAIGEAARRLLLGHVVALPTETVYGLAGRTSDLTALQRIYALKGRPEDNPLIAHVLDANQAQRLTPRWSAAAQQLADAFWPGPLTLILPRHPDVPAIATGGRSTIAIRAPHHDVFRAVLARTGSVLSAPSANRSGHISPTLAQHVANDFADDESLLILDGGATVIGIESTVLDLTTTVPLVRRPGAITIDAIRDVIGDVDHVDDGAQSDSPGTSSRHYAPRTPATLVATADLRHAIEAVVGRAVVVRWTDANVPAPHESVRMPDDPVAYAAALYRVLRDADACAADAMLIERPPETPAWRAIYDRLRRATIG